MVALILIGVFLFPIRYPVITSEPDRESANIFHLHKNQPLVFKLPASANFSMLTLWVRPTEKLPSDTPLELRIINRQTGEEKRLKKELLSSVYDPQTIKIRFPFFPLSSHDNTEWTIIVAAPELEPEHAIALDPPIAEMALGSPVAFRMRTTLTLTNALTSSIFAHSTEGEDIQYYWHRGSIIAHGGNPYECVLDDSCISHKNPGHFPLFYWLSALSQKMGLKDFGDWISFWRPVLLLFWLGTAALLFVTLYRRQQYFLAFFGALFWLFNRWSLYVAEVGQIGFISIFFLTLSLLLLPKRFWLAVVVFSVSLAIKQVGIFIVPLYLVYAWHRFPNQRIRQLCITCLVIASVPVITLLPFILDSPRGVFMGLFFSVVRTSADLGAPSFNSLLEIPGAIGIMPMLLLMGLVYLAAWRERLSIMSATLLTFFVFLGFNSVLFNQYFPWALPFLPLAASEAMAVTHTKTKKKSEQYSD